MSDQDNSRTGITGFELRSALLFIAIALIGGVVGSYASYLGERSNVDRQQKHERIRHVEEARGVARAYREQVLRAEVGLDKALHDHRWPYHDEERMFELPSSYERSEVLALMPISAVEDVARADSVFYDVYSQIENDTNNEDKNYYVKLEESDEHTVRRYINVLETAGAMLYDAGTPPRS